MIPVLTPAEMRKVDRHAIKTLGIPGRVLMEHAGRAVAERLSELLSGRGSVAVICGSGNNAGDGFVAARFLTSAGHRPHVYLAAHPDRLHGDALESYELLTQLDIPQSLITDPESLRVVDFSRYDWLLDALIGTGLRGAVADHYADVIGLLNSSGVPILACDIPSGIDGETGRGEGRRVRAQETVTLGLPKPGLLLYPGAEHTGRVHIADVGLPRESVNSVSPDLFLVGDQDVPPRLPQRRGNAHKGEFGRVFLIAGSRGMTGAAALSGEAALRIGAGLVTVGTPRCMNDVLEVKLTEAMTLPLADRAEGSLGANAEIAIREHARRSDVLAIGPGISQHDDVRALVHHLFADWSGMPDRIVIDADALNVCAPLSDTEVRFPTGAVLTPHPGEAARLLGIDVPDVESARIDTARRLSADTNTTVVLKGAPTVIASPDGRAYLNPTGNSGMATAGSGDVLTGAIAGLLGQGLDPLNAAIAGVYLHGLAGDLAADELGAGLLAGDILRMIPNALMAIAPDHQPRHSSWQW